MRKYIRHFKDRIRLNKKSFIVYSILRGLVILTAVRCLMERNIESFATCLLSLVLFLLPSLFEEMFRVDIPAPFEIIIYIFIFSAEILGEINRFYVNIQGWDTIMHTLNGFLCAAIGFAITDMFNRKKGSPELSPLYLAIVAFCFSMTVGVIWEFIEFGADRLLGVDMQKDAIVQSFASNLLDPSGSTRISLHEITETIIVHSKGTTEISGGYLDIGIIDTMKDLLVNFIGAIVFSVIGYFYVKDRERSRTGRIAEGLIIRTLSDDEYDKLEEEIRRLDAEAAEKRNLLKFRNKVRRK